MDQNFKKKASALKRIDSFVSYPQQYSICLLSIYVALDTYIHTCVYAYLYTHTYSTYIYIALVILTWFKAYGRICISYMQMLLALFKGFEHLKLLVSMGRGVGSGNDSFPILKDNCVHKTYSRLCDWKDDFHSSPVRASWDKTHTYITSASYLCIAYGIHSVIVLPLIPDL